MPASQKTVSFVPPLLTPKVMFGGLFSMLRTVLQFATFMRHFYCLSVYKMLQSML
jgi:hypothetical protein